jgi:hypothetical protein
MCPVAQLPLNDQALHDVDRWRHVFDASSGTGSQWHQAHAQIVDTPTVEGKPHGGALSRPGEMGALCVPWIPDLAVAKKVVIAR